MWSDGSDDELHEIAEKIGLKKSWFQKHIHLSHYDLTPGKRDLAIENGAVPVSNRDLSQIMANKIRGRTNNVHRRNHNGGSAKACQAITQVQRTEETNCVLV